MFQTGTGKWTEYRSSFSISKEDEIDFHFGRRPRDISHDEAMGEVRESVIHALKEAQQKGRNYVMFVHGSSTSGPWRKTARSVVRGFMRSPEATPLIERAQC